MHANTMNKFQDMSIESQNPARFLKKEQRAMGCKSSGTDWNFFMRFAPIGREAPKQNAGGALAVVTSISHAYTN